MTKSLFSFVIDNKNPLKIPLNIRGIFFYKDKI